MSGKPVVTIRPARPGDVPPMCDLLNAIILAGGTTAFETPFTATGFADYFFRSQIHISCLVAEGQGGEILGFQMLAFHEKLPDDWGDIATFARADSRALGVGKALFSGTVELAGKYGLVAINATIRADNAGGLAYYDRLGFVTWNIDKSVPLRNGHPVDRISKRYAVRETGTTAFEI
jgi:L-amino acid N-acyltransferase YncA